MRGFGNRSRLNRMGRLGAQFVRRQAAAYAREPQRLGALLRSVQDKAQHAREPLTEVWDDFMLLVRMLRAYHAGQYRTLPWRSLLLVVGAVLYFVMPADLIPDLIPGVGLLDDAAVIAWTVRTLRTDLAAFRSWEQDTVARAPTDPA